MFDPPLFPNRFTKYSQATSTVQNKMNFIKEVWNEEIELEAKQKQPLLNHKWKKIKDFLSLFYEVFLCSIIVCSSLIHPNILSSFDILWWIIYLFFTVRISKKSERVKLFIMFTLLIYSTLLIFAKSLLVGLLFTESLEIKRINIWYSFGIVMHPKNNTLVAAFKTFSSDIITLLTSTYLWIKVSRRLKHFERYPDELSNKEYLDPSLTKNYRFWPNVIWVCILLSWTIIPSVYSLVNVMFLCLFMYLWALKIEFKLVIFHRVSLGLFFISILTYMIASYILLILLQYNTSVLEDLLPYKLAKLIGISTANEEIYKRMIVYI